mmetsp:Transcript_24455/g.61499  ORF Transcript_24455/g.61499 Transcript_24455/m.61499 type:complete len:1210 (-) Transcript_24455:326-3955(-)
MTMTASGARISGAGNFAPRSIPLRDNDGLLTSSTVAAFVTQRAMPVQQPLSARPGSSSLSTYSTSGFYTGRSDLLGENSIKHGVASSKQRKHATAVSPFSQSVKQQLERTAADVSVSLSYQTPRYSYNSSVSGVVAPEQETVTDALSATSKGRVVVNADPTTAANQQRRQYQQAPVAKNETASDTRTAVTSGTPATTGIVVPSVALTPSWLKAPVLSHKDLSQVPRIAPVSLRSVVNEELLSQSQHIARAQSLSASTARVVVQPLMHAQHHFSFAPTPRDSGSGASALDRSNAGAITVPHPTSTSVSIPHPVSTATAASSSKAAKPRTQSSTSATAVSTTTTTRAAPAQFKSTNLLNLGAGFSTKIGVPELKFDAVPLSARLPSHSEPPSLPPPIGVAIPRLNLPAPTGAPLSARTTVNTVSAVNTQRTEPQDESATATTSSRTSRTPRRPHFAPEVFLAGQHSTQKPNRQAQLALAGHSSSPAKKSGPVFVGSPERRPPKWSVPAGQDGAAVGKLDESLLSLASSGRQPQRSTRNSQFKNGSPVRTGPVLAYYHDGAGDDEGCGKNGSLHEELLSESMKALMGIDLNSIGSNRATSAVSSEAEHPGRSHYPSKFHPDATPLKTDHLSHSRTSASHAEQQAHDDQVEVDPLLGSCASFSSRSSCFTEEREIQQELKKHNLPLLQPEWNTKPLNSKAVATFDQISQLQSDPHSVDGNRGKAFSTQNARVVVAQKKSAYEVECMRLDRLVQDGLCQQKFYLKKIAERAQAVKRLVEEDLHVAGNKVRAGLKRWEDLKIYVASAEEVVVNLEGVYLEEVNAQMEKAQSALVEAGVIALGSKNAVELETGGGETARSSGSSRTVGIAATPTSARGINKTTAGIKSSATTPFCPLFSLAGRMRSLAKNFQAKVSALDKVLAKRRAESRLGLKERIDRLDAEIAEASKIVADLVQLSKYGDLLQSVVSETVEDRVETGVRTLEKAVAKVYSVVVQCKKDQDASFPICGRSELTMREKQQQAGNGSYGDALAQGSKAPASNTGDNHAAVARCASSPTRAVQHGVVMYASVAATTPRDVTVVTKKSKKQDAHHDIGFVTTCPTGKNTLLSEPNKNVPASHSTRTPRVVGPSSPSLKRAASHATSEIGSETLEAALRAKDETVTIVKDYMPERDTKLTVVVKPASPPEKPKWKVGSYSATSITAPMGRAGRREGVGDN